ncbi:flagellar biosynthetic protein FliO [Bacillus sp. Au-Bac7]|uniref:flagellar biosynthetic protein FliO n=1 Tax=Bacillus sp. Au-Bac7 TaxID=2906458 RepID=UPI001E3005BB|nr:flagellar biosynthetic protein FliO [Bacillus sp. Au-Bac7]MCE4048300.1 flagellar biosynthetic protein FliO [Bacillus sp. Au-Bac7]
MNTKQLFIKCSLLLIVLLGFNHQAYAEQLDNSVYDAIEKNQNQTEENNKSNKQTDNGGTEATTETNDTAVTEAGDVGLTFWDFVRMIFATLFVIALLYVVLRFINKRNHVFKSTQIIENLGGTTLGANRSIQIVKVGKRLLVVGVGESIQLIKEIDDEEEYKSLIKDYNQKMDQLIQPSDIVTKVMNGIKNYPNQKQQQQSFASHLKKQLQEVSNGRKEIMNELKKRGSEKDE